MRLRNVKDSNLIINNSRYIIKDYKKYKGNFKSLFKNDNKINIEIGMGKGDFIIGMAKLFPNINFIGIEKFDSVIARAIQKIDLEDIENVKLIKMDALLIDEVFSKEINLIYLNFSDPWPKKRHSKRRLTSHTFLKKYDNIFEKNNNIWLKTDNKKLFEFSIESLSKYGYTLSNVSLDLHNSDFINNVKTEYEEKFSKRGFTINRLEAYIKE